MENNKLDEYQRPFAIIGMGKSGLAAQKLLLNAGLAEADIILFDEKNQAYIHDWNFLFLQKKGTLIVSPGVPLQNVNLQKLISSGWQLASEITLATHFLKNEKIIGITGSVAKSTVTSLIGEGIKAIDPHTFVGGNLGTPFAEYVNQLFNGAQRAQWVVLELSSYQLENCKNLNLEYSVITFLSANHLERYKTLHDYYKTKCDISLITNKKVVLNSNSEDIKNNLNLLKKDYELISFSHIKNKIDESKISLMGSHNRDNLSLAFTILNSIDPNQEWLTKLYEFKGLAHRIEFVRNLHEVTYINDSKATAMDSVMVAVEAAFEKRMHSGKVKIFLGGKDKNLPWEQLTYLNEKNNLEKIFFGQCGELARAKMNCPQSVYYTTLKEALASEFKKTHPGDVVLLSPGGTSLDEFKGFEDRGNYFKSEVMKLS